MRRSVTAVLTAGLLAAGVLVAPLAQASPVPQPPPGFVPAPVVWGPCEASALVSAGAECGFVAVPLDHDDPTGPTIEIAVSRVVHTTPQSQGVMLVNPGGPGGSGLTLALLGGAVPNGAGASYDWIGFDPRGVGSSRPALSCIPDYSGFNRPDYRPEAGTEQAWLDRSRSYAEACATNGGPLLDHLKSIDTVRDMDVLRAALGQEQINYYGFSYGTYLGQVYATLFPDRVRRLVMDGVVDVRNIWYEANLNQDVAFERTIGAFFDWIAKNDAVYGLGTSGEDVEALYYSVQDDLRAAPAGGIGPAEWNDLFLSAGYNVLAYPGIAQAFSAYVNDGDVAALEGAYGFDPAAPDDNGYAIYLAVQCTDLPWPDYERVRADNTRVDAVAPFETWANAWFNGPCSFWPAQAGTPVEVDGSGVAGALLLSETFDGATPFDGALNARELFPNAVLVEGVGGFTHSASLSGVACTDTIVADYLATGALPARQPGSGRSDVQCDPLPQPDAPAPAAAS
ncbi:alpha/beta fold hydrolase [Pseudonocardia oceani]|uniref:Alpha/beta fold hydrolase n=1 Tax=Pseudonocardia oceani TaxID=2792013 RepID=A0ABS6UCK0_9PSEU|nr:alpha/beta fold hydrolase [Pseudonocardia oceani]